MEVQKALNWITDILAVNNRTLALEDTRMSVSEWDSLGSLMLMSRLEEEYGIMVTADQMEAIQSVREICDLLEKKHAFCTR